MNASPEKLSPLLSTRRVLVIDDNPDDQDLYRRALRKVATVNYQFTGADDGDAGLEAIESLKPDCVLLDYSLPGKDGLEVLAEIRERFPFIPVVVLTGYGNDSVAVSAMRIGAQDYISKANIDKELLHQTIQNACERQALQIQVARQQEALALFTRVLAHDLKEPVRSARSFCQLVADTASLDQSSLHYLDIALAAIDHMGRLIDRVRDFTSLQNEGSASELSDVSARSLVDQALLNLQQQLKDVPHEIEIGELPELSVDPIEAVSLFQNLISNALNHGSQSVVKIRIHAGRLEDRAVVIFVEDNGPGVDPALGSRIFEPFKRWSDGRSKGCGLGLSICQKIAERHQGRVWYEAAAGGGSRFCVSLPRSQGVAGERGTRRSGQDAPAGPALRLANVLHVDDNPNDLLLTKLTLEQADRMKINLFNAFNGSEALQFLRDETKPPIDLILLDINMPVMDGFEFLRSYGADGRGKEVPVIICSTSNDKKDQRCARDLGAKAYVTKPIGLASLEPAIRSLPSFVLSRREEGVRLEVTG